MNTKYIINGGKPLHGEVHISGAKNAAVALIPATLLIRGVCRIENIPQISDVTMFFRILETMGAKVTAVDEHTYDIDCTDITTTEATCDLMQKLRASYYLIGALLGRFGKAKVAMPGGCNFGGERPIDQHIKGFKALGANVEQTDEFVIADTENGLIGNSVYLDIVSVGATINIILAAVLAKGNTVIENAAREPHIVDLANFLNSMGADIRGAGTNVIKIRGVEKLHGGSYSMIPDQIEAGTFMAAVAATGGEVLVKNVIPKHLDCITGKLVEMGVSIIELDDSVLVKRAGKLRPTNVKTMPYPGFPTDMQPQIATALCLAEGKSIVTEGIFSSRYKYVAELIKMGAKATVTDHAAEIEGVSELHGASVTSYDLRAGAAMVIAGLAAHGTTVVDGVNYIERGYENIIEKFRAIGADISCESAPDEDDAV